jgi:hypothetical protein
MAFRSFSQAIGPSAGSVVVNRPVGLAQNDIILFAMDCYSNPPTFPSGFTLLPQFTSNGGESRADSWAVAWKLATASEPSTYTGSASGAGATLPGIVCCSSGRVTAPGTTVVSNNFGNSGTNGPLTAPATGYTATALDDVIFFGGLAATSGTGTWATTTSSPILTMACDQNGTPGTFSSGTTFLAYGNAISAGATGNLSFTETGSGVAATAMELSGILIQLPNGIVITPTSYTLESSEYF